MACRVLQASRTEPPRKRWFPRCSEKAAFVEGNQLWGGDGLDIFQVTSSADQSIIYDFDLVGEVIRFSTLVAADYTALTISDDANGDAHVTVGGIDITVIGATAAQLGSSSFEFGLFS